MRHHKREVHDTNSRDIHNEFDFSPQIDASSGISMPAIFKTGNGESGNGNGEWERGMGTGNLRGMTGESAGNDRGICGE